MAMSKYETMIWEEKMKEQIKCQAHALYIGTRIHPRGSVLEVIHTQVGYADEKTYDTHLVVFKAPGTEQKFEFVLSVHKTANVAGGLQNLLERLRIRMGVQIHHDRIDKEIEDSVKLCQDLKEFREQWVPGR